MIAWDAKVVPLLHTTAPRCRTNICLVRVKCSPDDTVGDLKKLIAAQTGTDWKKIQLKKWYDVDSMLLSVAGRA
jgi:hypothetical protein